MTRPRVILFDLGGVLLPFDRGRRTRALAHAAGCEPEQAAAFLTSPAVADLFSRQDLGLAGPPDFAVAFSDFAGRPVTAEEAKQLILSVFADPDQEVWGLAAKLAERFRVGGFSDNPAYVAELFPPDAPLDPMLFSCELGALKPSTAAFEAALARLGADPGDILFIDDAEANVVAAAALGWGTVRFVSCAQLAANLERLGLI